MPLMLVLRVILVAVGAIGAFTVATNVSKPEAAESVTFGGIQMSICWGVALLLWRMAERKKAPTKGLDAPAMIIALLATALVTVFAVVPGATQQSGIGSVSANVSGDLVGYGYELKSEGSVHSDKFEQTIVTLHALNTGEASRTPELTAVVVLADGYENNCENSKGYVWSRGVGEYSDVDLLCLLDLDPDELAGIKTVRVSEK